MTIEEPQLMTLQPKFIEELEVRSYGEHGEQLHYSLNNFESGLYLKTVLVSSCHDKQFLSIGRENASLFSLIVSIFVFSIEIVFTDLARNKTKKQPTENIFKSPFTSILHLSTIQICVTYF